MIILLFLSAVFAPLPLPIPKTLAILPETHHKFGPASLTQNLKLSKEQQLVRLNALYALPDDIQVKIISDTQNAQNAIQWLKMNKASSDKLIKDPNFQPMLPEVLKLSIVDKYYDADILKRILDEPNLVNWNLKGVQSDAKYALDIETFAKVIDDVDLSSAAGEKIQEYSLMNIGKFIDENPGKSLELVSRDSDIMAKIILSDSALTTKFTNDLSIADPKKLQDIFNSINTLKLILKNPIFVEKINIDHFELALYQATLVKNNEIFSVIIENYNVASRMDANMIDITFRVAIREKNDFAIESIMNRPHLFEKVSKTTRRNFLSAIQKKD